MPEPEAKTTKTCPNCDAEIGTSETTCPKCSVDFEELEDTLASVERANAIIDKRKKAALPPTPKEKPEAKKSKLRSLGSILRKKPEAK